MSKEVIKSVDETQDAIEKCLLDGDLSQLSLDQRLSYYKQVCETVGLNPLTKPFQYIVLNGKLTMYALKGATDQLRRIYDISCEVKNTEKIEDLYVVTVKAINNKNGRVDEDMGFAKISGMKGDMLGNAMLKATTKAKRRVTLSMCGLGMLDEDEVATIQDDVGNGKGKKVFDAPELKGTDKLEATLSKSEPSEEEKEQIMEEESEEYHKNGKHPEASKQWLNDSILQLNRIFARYNDHDETDDHHGTEITPDNTKIVDTLSGLVEDLRNEVVDYGVDYESLRTWAKDHPGNKVELKRYATTHNEDWQDTMVTDDYDELYRWMAFLAEIFKAKEEVA